MTTRPETTAPMPELDDETVAEYLRAHPDFLERHEDVLVALDIPHRPGPGAVSLIERQVATLRHRNERLEHKLAELMHTARENERVGARLLMLGRGLLEAESLDGVLALVRDTLLTEFAADEAMIVLIDPDGPAEGHFLGADDPIAEAFDGVLERGAAVCGRLTDEQEEALFGDAAERISSAAVVPLRAGRISGLIGLGSQDAHHFTPDMGTLFLEQLGELVSAGVARYTQ
jgi:uncharacterized protein YigA (DUF484 family)